MPEGRFLKATQRSTGRVILQSTLPSKEACFEWKATLDSWGVVTDLQSKQIDVACLSESESNLLPFRATTRDNKRSLVVDTEFLTLADCASGIQKLEDQAKKTSTSDYEVVSYCRKK